MGNAATFPIFLDGARGRFIGGKLIKIRKKVIVIDA